jgi:hypothetical protein
MIMKGRRWSGCSRLSLAVRGAVRCPMMVGMQQPARFMGAATAAYGVAVLVRPEWMARPCGLVDDEGNVSTGVAALIRGIGVRDAAAGLAMAFAPTQTVLRIAGLVRVAADAGDATLLGAVATDPKIRRNIIAVAGGWGLLTLITLALAER